MKLNSFYKLFYQSYLLHSLRLLRGNGPLCYGSIKRYFIIMNSYIACYELNC